MKAVVKIGRILIGLSLWIGAIWGLNWLAFERESGKTRTAKQDERRPERLTSHLWSYVAGPRPSVELAFDQPSLVAVGDPIFLRSASGDFEQIGEIQFVASQDGTSTLRARTIRCQALFYPSAPALGPETAIRHFKTPDSMSWVLETMLPPEKRLLIAQELKSAYEQHHAEILLALRPLIDRSLRDAFAIIEQDLPAALAKRKPRFEALAARYEKEIIDAEILPLVRKEVWPILRQYAEPTAEEVGRQMLDRISLWSVVWRAGADQLPFTKQNRLEEEMRRFLREEAVPMLESRTDDFLVIQKKVIAEAANNAQVQAAVKRNVSRLLNDPELQQLLWDVIGDVALNNPRMHAALQEVWTSPEAHDAFQLAAEKLEPTVRRLGDMLFGTRKDGLSPEFAIVLRSQVLGKDKRWFVIAADEVGAADQPEASSLTLKVRRGGNWRDNPFVERLAP